MQKSRTLPTPSLMVQTVLCCLAKQPRDHTPFSQVRWPRQWRVYRVNPRMFILVLMMAETCYLAESAICYPPLYDELRNSTVRPTETVETVAMAAVAAASEQNASAILVLSTSGNTARLISKYRPQVPIITGEFDRLRRG